MASQVWVIMDFLDTGLLPDHFQAITWATTCIDI